MMTNPRSKLGLYTVMIGYYAYGKSAPVELGYAVGGDYDEVERHAQTTNRYLEKYASRLGLKHLKSAPRIPDGNYVSEAQIRRDGILPERGEVQLRFKSRAFERKFDELIGT